MLPCIVLFHRCRVVLRSGTPRSTIAVMSTPADKVDSKLSKPWFADYTDEVVVHDDAVSLPSFDAEARYEENDDTEYVLFADGLGVAGLLTLGEDTHSIYAVLGSLKAKQLILGDAVMVVEGTVSIEDWVLLPEGEGLFEVNGHQIEGGDPAEFAKQLDCPVMALYSREEGGYLFFAKENGSHVQKTRDDLVPELAEADDEDIAEHLKTGKPLFS